MIFTWFSLICLISSQIQQGNGAVHIDALHKIYEWDQNQNFTNATLWVIYGDISNFLVTFKYEDQSTKEMQPLYVPFVCINSKKSRNQQQQYKVGLSTQYFKLLEKTKYQIFIYNRLTKKEDIGPKVLIKNSNIAVSDNDIKDKKDLIEKKLFVGGISAAALIIACVSCLLFCYRCCNNKSTDLENNNSNNIHEEYEQSSSGVKHIFSEFMTPGPPTYGEVMKTSSAYEKPPCYEDVILYMQRT